jgi:phenylalanyl-tRNA synthetase alpha chain
MSDERHCEELMEDPRVGSIYQAAVKALENADTLELLQEARIAFIGRKGKVSTLLQGIKDLPPEERKRQGKLGNYLKNYIERALEEKGKALEDQTLEKALRGEKIDFTLPGRFLPRGNHHLLSSIIEEIEDIFLGIGYQVVEGPEVELDYYNFEALNTPDWHPSKSLKDTFYVQTPDGEDEDVLLRTHTSPVQVRVMETTPPPLYVIAPGKAFRYDVPDATHSPMFHQVEGLVVDEDISMGDLKGTLEHFAKEMFGAERRVRFRPHFFPFTEPSAEVDVSCFLCQGEGCRVCKGTGWLEILGSGMVDPNVFGYVGYDPEKVSGFAFGMGVERIAMLKYGVPDIRYFFDNDLRLLSQF